MPALEGSELDATRTLDAAEPLDAVSDPNARFGTYAALTRDDKFKFVLKRAPRSA